jgi:hypothetical protein
MNFTEVSKRSPCRCQDKIDKQEKLVEIIVAFRNLHDKIEISVYDLAELVGCVLNQMSKVWPCLQAE